MNKNNLCLKCKKNKKMKNFDVCFDCYIGESKSIFEIMKEERVLEFDIFD